MLCGSTFEDETRAFSVLSILEENWSMANGQWLSVIHRRSTVSFSQVKIQGLFISAAEPTGTVVAKSAFHALAECKTGGNVISHHNEIENVLVVMASRLSSHHGSQRTLITSCVAVKMSDLDQAIALF
jgi:hypothetical protein